MSSDDFKWNGEIQQGQIVTIIGAPKSGKSTLLDELLTKTKLKPHHIKNVDEFFSVISKKQEGVVLIFSHVDALNGIPQHIAFHNDLVQTENTVVITCSKMFAQNWLVNIPKISLELNDTFHARVVYKSTCFYRAEPPLNSKMK